MHEDLLCYAGDHQTFPPVVLLIAALGLLFYGLLGIALGFAGVVFSAGSVTVTTIILAIEFVFGWCVPIPLQELHIFTVERLLI